MYIYRKLIFNLNKCKLNTGKCISKIKFKLCAFYTIKLFKDNHFKVSAVDIVRGTRFSFFFLANWIAVAKPNAQDGLMKLKIKNRTERMREREKRARDRGREKERATERETETETKNERKRSRKIATDWNEKQREQKRTINEFWLTYHDCGTFIGT